MRGWGKPVRAGSDARGRAASRDVNQGYRFVLPAVYPADLEVTLVAGRPRRSTFPLYSVIRDQHEHDRIYARAEATMVWIDLKDGKSRVLPDRIRAQLASE